MRSCGSGFELVSACVQFANLPLKFGQSTEDVKNQFPARVARGGCVDVLSQALKNDSSLLKAVIVLRL